MRLHILLVAIAICLALPAGAQTAPMDCTVGPVIKTFGGSKWVVNSCSDGHTVVLMTTNDSKVEGKDLLYRGRTNSAFRFLGGRDHS